MCNSHAVITCDVRGVRKKCAPICAGLDPLYYWLGLLSTRVYWKDL